MIPDLQRLLRPIKRNLQLIFGKAIVKAVYDGDKNFLQKMQLTLLKGELRDKVERYQNYGFTSMPLPGADAAVIFAGGNRDRGVIIAVDDRRYRLESLKSGEVAVYTDEGDYIHLKRGNIIDVKTKTFNVIADDACTIKSATIKLDGPATITGETSINSKAKVSREIEAQDLKAGGFTFTTHLHDVIEHSKTTVPTG